ncbi:hypothetical protein K3172_07625 [Qipengyuania sp. 6B39]|uniref:tetratricopeptide repeat protein n=1 Tax=Qipengyuania proteolytica TaxID=2867239 RepID=UPI001C893E19|nr:hypothetical protein [Qipengyuania proteolytica]MBX7495724.1 hypothetical protein [Qipengyuania proteolytica]
MTWLPILALALATFAVAVVVLKLPRTVWMLFGAALLFGLAGYGVSGSPGQPAAPKAAEPELAAQTGELIVKARREFYPEGVLPSRFVVTADAFARRGDFESSARFLRNAVTENPRDGEAWLALGNSLVEHADGKLTAAALFAYQRAEELQPMNPAPTYFLGLTFLREGNPVRTRELWVDLLEKAPEDSEWRPLLQDRLARLDALLGIGPPPPAAEEPQ